MNHTSCNKLHPRSALRFSWMFVLLACLSTGSVGNAQSESRPPNVVLILADDLGYGDLGCYGQTTLQTPNLDRLSRQGMRWTHFYAGSTVCAPSRCVLMTGKHTGRCLIRGNSKESLPAQVRTLPEVLKQSGYRCGLFGKWGLGQAGSSGTPLNKGFDAFFGYLDQTHAHNFFPTFLDENESRRNLSNIVPNASDSGAGVASQRNEDASELILKKAIEFVDKHRSEPFFLFYSVNLPHANNEAGKLGTQDFGFGKYSDKDWPDAEKGFAHMVEKMDAQVGKLVDHIDQLGLSDSTLVFFSSDNGPHHEGGHNDKFFKSSGAVRGSKRDLTDGGIRVPAIVR
ncbi:MAG: sulfatase-like hydrolase/transferase, partial [Pirellula sp.]